MSTSGRITIITTNCGFSALRHLRQPATRLARQVGFTLHSPYHYALKGRRRSCRSFATSAESTPVLDALKKLATTHGTSIVKKATTEKPILHEKFSRGAEVQNHEHRVLYYSAFLRDFEWRPLLEPKKPEEHRNKTVAQRKSRSEDQRNSMSSTIEILTTPTSDTPGTTLVLRTASKHYVFGSQAEGTQRALSQQGTRLLKASDFFLTGKAEWKNTGGFVGLMLTLADASSSSYEQAMELVRQSRSRGRTAHEPPRPRFNIYGPPNLKHTLGTCRRFIFRKGIPIHATEYTDTRTKKDDSGSIPPSWEDDNILVWALSVSPLGQQPDPQAEARLKTCEHQQMSHIRKERHAMTVYALPHSNLCSTRTGPLTR
jgi:hypothetical protein